MNRATIQVNTQEELASVIDQIVTSNAEVVALRIDEDAHIGQNVLNFRLLEREASNVGKKAVIISDSERIRNLASKASLPIEEPGSQPEESTGKESAGQEETATPSTPQKDSSPAEEGRRPMMDILPPDEQNGEEVDINVQNQPSQETRGGATKSPDTPKEERAQGTSEEESAWPYRDTPTEEKPQNEPAEEKHTAYSPEPSQEEAPQTRKSTLKSILKNNKGLPSWISGLLPKSGQGKGFFVRHPYYAAGGVLGAVVLAVFLYVATSILPKATITLYPNNVQEEIVLSMAADSNISSPDFSDNIIPAQVLEERKEKSSTFEASGTAEVTDKASGTITVYNEFSSEPQTLVASTRFVATDGELFLTTETVVIPGAKIESGDIIPSSTEVPVEAAEAGEKYNIGPTKFSIPGFKGTDKYFGFYGESEETMEGGFKGTVTVVTEEDIERGKEEIQQEFVVQVEEELRNRIPEGLQVLEDSFSSEVESLEVDAQPQDKKEQFNVKAVAVARTLLVEPATVDDAIAHHVANSTEYNKDFEISKKRSIDYNVKEVNWEEGVGQITANVNQTFTRRIDTNAYIGEIQGKNEAEVRRILSGKEALNRSKIRFWPFWVKSVPDGSDDIDVNVEYAASGEEQNQ